MPLCPHTVDEGSKAKMQKPSAKWCEPEGAMCAVAVDCLLYVGSHKEHSLHTNNYHRSMILSWTLDL